MIRAGAPLALALLTSALLAGGCRRRAPLPVSDAAAARSSPPDAGALTGIARLPADAAPAAARPRGRQLIVLHSANLRGEYEGHPLGGLARRATAVAHARAEGDGVVQVDAGDTVLPELLAAAQGLRVPPDPAEVERRARLVLAGLGAAGLDAFTPGECDLALGPARLARLARAARVPVIAANLVNAAGRPWFAPDRLVDAGGIPVGIIGLVTSARPDELARLGVTVGEPIAAARAALESLRARGARLVIAVLHLAGGQAEARQLLRAVPGIHLAVLGHDGAALEPPPTEGNTLLLGAGARGTDLGRLDLHLLGEGESTGDALLEPPSWFAHRLVRLDEEFGRAPGVRALVRAYAGESERRAKAGRPVGPGPQQPQRRPGRAQARAAEPPTETWTYASSAGCAFCHQDETAQWKTTAHAYALDTLASRSRQRDTECLGCHTTGFERPGGTVNLDTATTYFAGVGCESCHGPSVAHVRAQNRTGTRREVPEAVCRECHRADKSLTTFDHPAAVRRILGPGHGLP